MQKIILTLLFASCAWANTDIVGKWRQIDDETGKMKSIVVIKLEDEKYNGYIDKIFPKEGESTDPVCDKCKGEHKDQKIVGLKFLWGFKKDGEKYVDGKILDPNNGKVYSSKLKVLDGGKALDVRGFIGISLLGRSQKWERCTEADAC